MLSWRLKASMHQLMQKLEQEDAIEEDGLEMVVGAVPGEGEGVAMDQDGTDSPLHGDSSKSDDVVRSASERLRRAQAQAQAANETRKSLYATSRIDRLSSAAGAGPGGTRISIIRHATQLSTMDKSGGRASLVEMFTPLPVEDPHDEIRVNTLAAI